jgi:hypothetical protein
LSESVLWFSLPTYPATVKSSFLTCRK